MPQKTIFAWRFIFLQKMYMNNLSAQTNLKIINHTSWIYRFVVTNFAEFKIAFDYCMSSNIKK